MRKQKKEEYFLSLINLLVTQDSIGEFNFALNFYRELENFSGVHGENMILPSLYNLFMWDIIYYDKIPYKYIIN